jgi:hypothetical protein
LSTISLVGGGTTPDESGGSVFAYSGVEMDSYVIPLAEVVVIGGPVIGFAGASIIEFFKNSQSSLAFGY